MQPINLFVKCLPFVNIVHEFFKVDVAYLKRVNDIRNNTIIPNESKPGCIDIARQDKKFNKRAFAYGMAAQSFIAITMVALGALTYGMMFILSATTSAIYIRCSDRIAKAYVEFQNPNRNEGKAI